MTPRQQKPTEAQSIAMSYAIITGWFGPDDIRERRRNGISSFHVFSRDLTIALLIGPKHGWHWPDDSTINSSDAKQVALDAKFRQTMQAADANLICIWDETLDELILWLAMGAPDGQDWHHEYSWLPDRNLHPGKRPREWRNPSRMTSVVKHYQHDVIFARELALWHENGYLDRQNDKRRIQGALYANRFHYTDKLPNELSDAAITRGLRIAGYVQAYSSYDPHPLVRFLQTHPSVQSVADPCAGWGERMLACASLGVAYHGYDVNDALASGYHAMISDLPLGDVAFEIADAANIRLKPCDAFVCCPPYGNLERYSEQGAENLDQAEFVAWWGKVCANMLQANPRYICITSNRKCHDLFLAPLLSAGFDIQSEIPVKRSRASHFQRKKAVSLKRECETFIVLSSNDA